jgi:uncharacterized protein YndB with AHSA1/START domain
MSKLQTESLLLTRVPIAETGMLIRKPVADVFEAIVNPEITTKFWFTRSSGRLVAGRPVRWDWEMYGVSIEVTATAIEPNRRIVIEWPGYSGPTTVEWTFAPLDDGTTFVRVNIVQERGTDLRRKTPASAVARPPSRTPAPDHRARLPTDGATIRCSCTVQRGRPRL